MGRLSQVYQRSDLGYFGVSLYDPKNSFNVGGAIRATGAFDGRQFIVQGNRWREKGGDWRHMDTEGAHLRMPVHLGVDNLIQYQPFRSELVAVEMSDKAENLVDFVHPKVAQYIFGPEDGSLPDSIVEVCDYKVYIPTQYSLNLYTAVACLAYDRTAKLAKLANTGLKCPICENPHYRKLEDVYLCNACPTRWKIDPNDGHEYDVEHT